MAAVAAQERGEAKGANGYDTGDVQEGGQSNQDRRNRRKKPVAVYVRANVGEHPGERQRLKEHLRAEVAGEPHLGDVDREKGGPRESGAAAKQPGPDKVDGEHAEQPPESVYVAGSGKAVRLVGDRDPHRIQVRELADYRPGVRV